MMWEAQCWQAVHRRKLPGKRELPERDNAELSLKQGPGVLWAKGRRRRGGKIAIPGHGTESNSVSLKQMKK